MTGERNRHVADVAVFLATDATEWVTGQNIGAGTTNGALRLEVEN